MTDQTIRVKGDVKQAEREFRNLTTKINDMGEAARGVAAKAGIAFGAMVGAIGLTVSKYAVQERAVNSLNASLKNQGIYSDGLSKKYQDLASAIQKYTTYGDEEIIQAQARLQNYAGQMEITEDLTKSVVDFAAANEMDLKSAFDLVGKSISSSTNALGRYGIEIDTNATKQEKMTAVAEALNKRYKGQAAAQAEGAGRLKQLSNSFGDFLEVIGKQFTPAISAVAKKMTEFIDTLNANAEVAKFAGIVLGVGVAISGVVAAVATFLAVVPSIVSGFALVTAAVKGLNLAFLSNPIVLAVAAIVAAIGGLYLAWKTNFLGIQEIAFGVFGAIKGFFSSFIENVSKMFGGLGDILVGVFTLDRDRIKSGLSAAMDAVADQIDSTAKAYQVAHDQRLEQIKKEGEEKLKSEIKIAQVASDSGLALSSASPIAKPMDASDKKVYLERLKEQEKIADDFAKKEQERKAKNVNLGLGLANNALNGRQGASAALGTGAGMLGDMMMPGIGGAVGGLVTTLMDAGPEGAKAMIKEFAESLPDLVIILIETLTEAIPQIIDSLVTVLILEGGLERIVVALVKAMPRLAVSLFNTLFSLVGRAIGGIGKALGSAVFAPISAGFDAIRQIFSKVFDLWLKPYRALFDGIQKALSSIFGLFKKGFELWIKPYQIMFNGIKSIFETIKSFFDNFKMPSLGGGGGGLLGGKVVPGFLAKGRAPIYSAEGWAPKWPDTQLHWIDPRERILSNADNKTVIKGINSILSKVSGNQDINLSLTFRGDGIQEFIQKSLVQASALGTGRIQLAVGSES